MCLGLFIHTGKRRERDVSQEAWTVCRNNEFQARLSYE